MAIGSGLGSSFGFSRESTYGTYVAPTKFLRAKSYTISRTQERPQGEGITSGVPGALGAHYVETVNGASGSVTFDVTNKVMGLLLESLTGGTSSSAVETGAAYKQIHTLAADTKKPLTFQMGVPYRTGTVAVKTATGCKVTGAEFSCDTTGILSANVNFDAQKYDEGQTLAAVSYLSSSPFHGKQSTLKMGTFGAEVAQTGITSVSLNWNNPMDTDDYNLGGAGLKVEPVANGFADISGSITADWTTAVATGLHDRMIANTSTSISWEFIGALITGAIYERIVFSIPGVFFTGDPQSVGGAETLSNSYAFTWKYDGTNLPSITVGTTETAL